MPRPVSTRIAGALVTLLCCTLPLRALHAQAILVLLFGDKFASETVQGGVKFDVVGTTLAGLPDAERKWSWALGGFIEVKLDRRLSIQPEFTFKSPAGAQGLPFVPTGEPEVDNAFTAAADVSVTRTLGYITIPVLLKLTAGRFRFGAGPQIGYLVRAEDRYIGSVAREDDLSYTKSLWSRVHYWDGGISLLGEFALAPHLGLRSGRVRVTWYRSFGDVLSDTPGGNDVLGIGFALPIGGPPDSQK